MYTSYLKSLGNRLATADEQEFLNEKPKRTIAQVLMMNSNLMQRLSREESSAYTATDYLILWQKSLKHLFIMVIRGCIGVMNV